MNCRSLYSCAVLLLLASVAWGEDSPSIQYFRRDGGAFAGKAQLPNDLAKDADQVWRTPLNPGISTPCVTGDRVILTTYAAENKILATVCLDRVTGEVLWSRPVPATEIEKVHNAGSPASSSAASNGKQVFVFYGSYGLLCYDLEGKLLWEKKMGPFQDEFGASSSPILVDDNVILNQDHDVDSYLIAIDQKTGKTVWRRARPERTRSYSTPAVWLSADGRKQIIVAGSLELAAYDPNTGEKIWWVDVLSRIVDPTPIVTEKAIYLATWTPGGDPEQRIEMEPFDEALANLDVNKDGKIAKDELPAASPVVPRFFRIDLDQDTKLDQREWEKHAAVFSKAKNVAISVRPDGQGDVTATHVNWIAQRGLPTVPSSTVYDGVLYMVKDSGIVTSLDAVTGDILQQGRAEGAGNYYASLLAGDGKVYLASERGVLTILRASRSWSVLSSHDFKERIMATPTVIDGTLFVRTDEAMYAFRKKGE